MIFNTEMSAGASLSMDAVQESKYALGIEGALMHVYENQCNYNAMMKAVGISEMKYYQENGKELFLNEAGAFGSFITKAKEFFKKVWEKIKGMFKQLFMKINSFVASDKDFVNKYEKDIVRKWASIKKDEFNFKGYKFDIDLTDAKKLKDSMKKLKTEINISNTMAPKFTDNDALQDHIEKEVWDGKERSEYIDDLKEETYGSTEKEELDNINIRQQLAYIKDTKSNIKDIEAFQAAADAFYKKLISELDKAANKAAKDTENDRSNYIKAIDEQIAINKANSDMTTVSCGVLIQAVKDRNRQAKAICVKVMGTKVKKESATLESGDIFAGVEIK